MLCLSQVSMQPTRPNLSGLSHNNTAQEDVNRATPPFLTDDDIEKLYFLFVLSPRPGASYSEMVLHIKRRIDELTRNDDDNDDDDEDDEERPHFRPSLQTQPSHIDNNHDDDSYVIEDDEEMPRYPSLWRD